MAETMTQDLHDEFVKRVDENFHRIDTRLNILEEEMRSYTQLAISIERLSSNTESLCKEIQEQSTRLKALEDRDGEKWRSVVGTVVTVIVGAVIGFVFASLGIAA